MATTRDDLLHGQRGMHKKQPISLRSWFVTSCLRACNLGDLPATAATSTFHTDHTGPLRLPVRWSASSADISGVGD